MERRFGRFFPDTEALHGRLRTEPCFVCRLPAGSEEMYGLDLRFGCRGGGQDLYSLRRIRRGDAEEISRWRYPEPYSTYNGNPASVSGLLDPRYNYHAVTDENGGLVGYFCFGADATVPAGRRLGLYSDKALDIGLGMRPDLTGLGNGAEFLRAGLRFAARTFSPAAFRLTVATFNHRAIKVYEKAGFEPVQTFGDRDPEWLLMRRRVDHEI